jgi:cell division protein FtsQ
LKLFRNKNRGPKVKREDVVIPEEYLEYERLSEEKRRRETASAQTQGDKILDDAMMAHFATQEQTDQAADPVEDGPKDGKVRHLFNFRKKEKEEAEASSANKEDVQIQTEAEENQGQTQVRRHRRRFPWLAAGLIVLAIAVAGATTALLSSLMAIDQVQVNGLKTLNESQVLKMAGQPEGKNVFLYRAGNARKELALYPYVKSVEIHRHLPHSLEITIEEREPAGLLLDNGNYLQFSKDGILLDNSSSLSGRPLPIITGFSMADIPAPGEKFKDDDRFQDALTVINACTDDLLTMLQEINIEDRQNILAYTSQGIEVRIGSIDNINARMAALNDIMDQVILSGAVEEPIKAIDIRYEKSPVIVLDGYDQTEVSAEDLKKEGQEKTDTGDSQTASGQQTETSAGANGLASGAAAATNGNDTTGQSAGTASSPADQQSSAAAATVG